MGKTTIEWTDYSSNPIRFRRVDNGKIGWACIKVATECEHCFAEGRNRWVGTRLPYTADAMKLVRPMLMEKELTRLEKLGGGVRVFVEDMSDLFGPWVQPEMLNRVFDVLVGNRNIRPQILTKWPGRMVNYALRRWGDRVPDHIWFGATWTGGRSLEALARMPARNKFLSVEPMLGPVTLCLHGLGVRCVIVGCESGPGGRPGARAMEMDWARSVRDQCLAEDVTFFLKQAVVDGKLVKLPELDGRVWNEWPGIVTG